MFTGSVRVKTMRFYSLLLGAIAAVLLAGCSAPPLEIALEASDMAYSVGELRAVAGQPVRLTFLNAGALEHDFNIGEIKISGFKYVEGGMGTHDHGPAPAGAAPQLHVMAMPGARAVAVFTPLEAGRYEFFCSTEGHEQAGMYGTLVVQ